MYYHKLIVFSGTPASGKTTLSKQLAEQNGYTRISMDEGGYVRHNDMIGVIIEKLSLGESVVADSIYDSRLHRESLLKAIENIECEKICIYMNTPLDECIRRNATRQNPLPSGLVKCIHEHFEKPSLDEGWDKIIYEEQISNQL